jgi:hypothetical protein
VEGLEANDGTAVSGHIHIEGGAMSNPRLRPCGHVTADQLAATIGVSVRSVQRRCKAGRIPAMRRAPGGKGYWIPSAWLEDLLAA